LFRFNVSIRQCWWILSSTIVLSQLAFNQTCFCLDSGSAWAQRPETVSPETVSPETVRSDTLRAGTTLATADPAGSRQGPIQRCLLGVGGLSKVGYPTVLNISIDPAALASVADGGTASLRVECQTVDVDGVDVVYRFDNLAWRDTTTRRDTAEPDAASPNGLAKSTEILIQNGRRDRPIFIRLYRKSDSADDSSAKPELLDEHELGDDERGTILPAEQPWLVSIGSDLNINSLVRRSLTGQLPSFSISTLESAAELPLLNLAYSGVDLVVLGTRQQVLIENVTEQQGEALVHWCRNGGNVLVSIGENTEASPERNWLSQLIPGTVAGTSTNVVPGPLESWVSSQEPVGNLSVANIIDPIGNIQLTMQNRQRDSLPIVIRRPFGFGTTTLFAVDLDDPNIAVWSDRNALLERLIGADWLRSRPNESSLAIAALGYSDMTGQLRATLDVFPDVGTATLTLLAICVGTLLLVLVPGDYFFSVRQLGRPRLTWWTLTGCVILASAGAAYLTQQWRPNQLAIHRVAVTDYDYQTQTARRQEWMHVYTGQSGTFDLAVDVEPLATQSTAPVLLDSLGQPGTGLGGFESDVTTEYGMPSYVVSADVRPSSRSSTTDNARSKLLDVGIATSGTKSFQSRWDGPFQLDWSTNQLTYPAGSDLLYGAWTNPFDTDLLNATVVYRSWIYRLRTRLRPGETITFSRRDQPKDFSRSMQGRQIIESEESGVSWDPTDRENMEDLIRMIMFHEKAGGEKYTRLSNRYLESLDLSHHLKFNKAILIAELPANRSQVSINRYGTPVEPQSDNSSEWIRVVLPVTQSN
jgi:hypothetical protein